MKTNFAHGGNVFAVARALGIAPEEILDFSANINPLGPAPGVRESMIGALDRLIHYPDSDCSELREALAHRHGVETINICVANGSTQLIYLMPRLVPGKRALVVAPAFSEYALALVRDGWQVEEFTLEACDGFALPFARLEQRVAGGYDLVVLANPGNPTGRLYSLAETEMLSRLCRTAGAFLVIDEAFIDFCEEASIKSYAAAEEGILVLRSLTKFYALPGLRLGYAIAAAPVISRLASLREPWSVNTVAQAAALASLAAPGYAEATRTLVAAERTRLAAGIAAIAGFSPFPSAANYLLVASKGGLSAGELGERVLAERILIRSCANFTGLGELFFRVAVKRPGENDRLLAALAAAARHRS